MCYIVNDHSTSKVLEHSDQAINKPYFDLNEGYTLVYPSNRCAQIYLSIKFLFYHVLNCK